MTNGVSKDVRDAGNPRARFYWKDVASATARCRSAAMAALVSVIAVTGMRVTAETCTWTGDGNDGRWSTAANWDVAPSPAGGDTLVFPSRGVAYATTNDYATFLAKQVRVSPDVANDFCITLAGGELALDNGADGTVITNRCPVTFDGAVRFARTERTYLCKTATFNGPVTIDGTASVRLNSSSYVGATFNAPVTGSQATLYSQFGGAGSGGTALFNAKVTVAILYTGRDYKSGSTTLNAPSNEIGIVYTDYSYTTLSSPNALTRDAFITWSGYYREKHAHTSCVYVNGEQQADRLGYWATSYKKIDSSATLENNVSERVYARDSASTLTLHGSQDALTCARLDGALSLVWDPRGAFTQDLRDRWNDCTGAFTVKGGTLRASGMAVFANVPKIVVAAGATFESAATNGVTFRALSRLDLQGAGAVFSVPASEIAGAANTPVADGALTAFIAKDAKIRVGAGVTVPFVCLVYDGVRVTGGTYTAANADWVEGAGSVTVSADKNGITFWTGTAENGLWADADNWSHGVPTATDTAYLYKNGAAVSVTFPSDATMPKVLYVRNETGSTTVTTPGRTVFENGRVFLERGALLEVPSGGEFVMDGCAGGVPAVKSGSAETLFSIAGGGAFRVSGGTAVFTNWYGQAVVAGDASGAAKLTMSEGLFTFHMKQEQNCLVLRDGGEFTTTGGEVRLSPQTGSWAGRCMPLRPNGGTVNFSGTTRVIPAYSFAFMPGTTRFSGKTEVKFTTTSLYVYSENAGDTAKVVFEDDATMIQCGDMLTIGGGPGTAVWVHDTSNATAPKVNYTSYSTWVGYNKGIGKMEIRRGLMKAGSRGYFVGSTTSSDAPGAEGVVDMTGGALEVLGNGSVEPTFGWGTSYPLGFLVGMDVNTKSYAHAFKGAFNMTDGALTNQYGHFIIGLGDGVGFFTQNGGDVYSGSGLSGGYVTRGSEWTIVGAIGMAGGVGTYEMTGGTATFKQHLFVGGVLTNEVRLSRNKLSSKYGIDRHDARGRLAVSGGAFKALYDVVVGEDGEGTIEVAGGGSFDVTGDLVLSNAVKSVLRFVSTASGFGKATVGGTLAVSDGAWIEVDLAGVTAIQASIPLLTFGARNGEIAPGHVVFKGPRKLTRVAKLAWTDKALVLRSTNGTVLQLR